MSQKSSINDDEPTPPRRSKRLLEAIAAKVQKPHSREIQVYTSPISSSLKTPITSLQNISCKKTHQGSVIRSANYTNSSNVSRRSTRKINGVEGFHVCRRSPRFPLLENTPEISDKKNSSNNGSKSSTRKINGVEGFQSCRRSPRFSIMEIIPEVFDKKNFVEKSNGLKMSTRKIDGVEGFQGCRQSPRSPLAEITPEMLDKKSCAKSNNGSNKSTITWVVGLQACEPSPRFPIMENSLEMSDKETGLNRENDQLRGADSIDSTGKEVLSKGIWKGKSVKRGRQSLEQGSKEITRQPEVGDATPNKGKEKKKRNVSCGTTGNWDKSDSQQCKENYGQEVHKRTSTHLRTPLSSVEKNSPKKIQPVCREKASKKLVDSKSGLNRSVKSICVSTKKTEKRPISNRCGVHGWTQDQELALQRAYIVAKPSPHFWKKISKMVPGKSAQDCFDKVQCNFATPPIAQPRYRSRANRANSSPLCHLSFSGSKLLEPAKLNVKRSRGNKRTKFLAQKTVRHLLQKQNLVNQGHKRDLFSVLEPTMDSFTQVSPEAKALSTPKCLLVKQNFLQNFNQRSLSAHKKPLSRFSGSKQAPPASPSPAVLKPIKDLVFHEKYIDQLHCREAKRTVGGRPKENRKEGVQKTDVIKAAKNALVSDATDMIKKFQHIEANAMESFEDLDDVDDKSGEEDEEYC